MNIIQNLKEKFENLYEESPTRFFFAPGRVNMIGEHTDYNGGHVFPCALTLGTYAAISVRDDNVLNLASLNIDENQVNSFDITNDTKSEKSWTDYPRGVLWAFRENNHPIPSGLNILFYGNIPAGSGLSSSASLEVLMGLILKSVTGNDDISLIDIALIGQQAENKYVGMNCGIMDQFASAMGKKDSAIFLDTQTLKYSHAPLALKDSSIVITNSLVKHELTSSGYNERRSQSEEALKRIQAVKDVPSLGDLTEDEFESLRSAINDDILERRAKHAVYENRRTIKAVKALENNDISLFGKLMNDSHISMEKDYEISCEELDFLAHKAITLPGVIGSRMTGGGFGGCTVSIVENEHLQDFKDTISKEYKEKYDITPEFYVVTPGEGAHEIMP